MSRIVSVWLRAWPIARLLRARASAAPAEASAAEAIDPRRPLVLVAPGVGGARIAALNRSAQRSGLAVGELLSNARSKVLDLQVRDADPAADAAALRKLALWGLRYTPVVAPFDAASGSDGLFLDIAGCAHLFGGEAELIGDLGRRLAGFGLAVRIAVADTAGAAWAMARHGRSDDPIVPPGGQEQALRPLPLAALRLSGETLSLLRRLGFRRIGELIGGPRAPFAARFERELLQRLDQALGRAPEPLAGIVPPPVYRATAAFLEPILSQEHVLEAAARLIGRVAEDLARDGAGARTLRLILFRVDGEARSLDIGLAAPSRDPAHIARLIGLRLDRLGDALDAAFGFEAAAIHVLAAEPLAERQAGLTMDAATPPPEALPQLIDRLQQRLGGGAVHSLRPHPSHIPERAVRPASPSPRASPLPLGRGREAMTYGREPRAAQEQDGNGAAVSHSAELVRGESIHDLERPPHPPLRAHSPSPRASLTWPRSPSARGEEPAPDLIRGRGEGQMLASARVAAPHPDSLPMPEKAWGEGIPAPRPLLLLPRPEAAEVVALVPEGPPRQFRWRGVLHQVAEAQGPERIAPEWWRRTAERTRDYYVVEDTAGRRFWLYRAGLYGRGGDLPPAWFVHGVFG
jgi:protein ImuB